MLDSPLVVGSNHQHGQALFPPSLSVHTLAAQSQSPLRFSAFTQLLYRAFLSSVRRLNVFGSLRAVQTSELGTVLELR